MLSQIDRFNTYNNMSEGSEFSDFEAELKRLLQSKRDFAIESETVKGLIKFREVEQEVERIQRKSLVPQRKSVKSRPKFVDEPSPRMKVEDIDEDYLLDKSASKDLDRTLNASGYLQLRDNVK